MRLCSLLSADGPFIGLIRGESIIDLNAAIPSLVARDVGALLRSGAFDPRAIAALSEGAKAAIDPRSARYRPLLCPESKVLCLGLNYVDHAVESQHARPAHPVLFTRVATSFVGHDEPLLRPFVSEHFDYEAELVAVIGRAGRHIRKERALEHVAGYTLMNDGSVRDYQVRTHQWTIGKNFDASGSIGPALVTADELPPGARGLRIEGRLNGVVMQQANTSEMIFDVETTIASLSEAITLEPGDLIAMGTPSGIGFARKPPVFMRAGDVFEVSVEGLGTLRNHVVDEPKLSDR